jgi:hypothetical protein
LQNSPLVQHTDHELGGLAALLIATLGARLYESLMRLRHLILCIAACATLLPAHAAEESSDAFLDVVLNQLDQIRSDKEKQIKIGVRSAADLFHTDVLANRAKYLRKQISREEFLAVSMRLYNERLKFSDQRRESRRDSESDEVEGVIRDVLTDIALK